MPIHETQLAPVIGSVIGFMEEALSQHESDQSEIANLRQKVAAQTQKIAQQDNIILEKVASAKVAASPTFRDTDIDRTLGHLVKLSLITPNERVKIAAEIKQNPVRALDLITQISEFSAPSDGDGIPKEAADTSTEATPDEWADFKAGRSVR